MQASEQAVDHRFPVIPVQLRTTYTRTGQKRYMHVRIGGGSTFPCSILIPKLYHRRRIAGRSQRDFVCQGRDFGDHRQEWEVVASTEGRRLSWQYVMLPSNSYAFLLIHISYASQSRRRIIFKLSDGWTHAPDAYTVSSFCSDGLPLLFPLCLPTWSLVL